VAHLVDDMQVSHPVIGLLTRRPAHLDRVSMQPRRTVQPIGVVEHGLCRRVQIGPAALPGRGRAVPLLVEPCRTHPEQQAADGVWHPVAGPLVSDEVGHAHLVASFTHMTTDRLSHRNDSRSVLPALRS
jgi:hypothetical protein